MQISEISRQGDGIARIQGFVIFVKGGKVGQKAKVRVTNVGARFATAEIVSEGQQQASSSPSSSPPAASTEEKQKDVAQAGEEPQS